MDFEPLFRGATQAPSVYHFRYLRLSNRRTAQLVGAVINSSLFFWWFVALGDGRNLTSADVLMFPIGPVDDACVGGLPGVFDELMADYRNNSIVRTRRDCQYQGFRVSRSKPIIDRIDT